jgi:hypothetical protein
MAQRHHNRRYNVVTAILTGLGSTLSDILSAVGAVVAGLL